jgi:hypothetical protein
MMKPNKPTKKLQLNKQAVSNLSKPEMQNIQAGDAWTTSIGHCSGFTCCGASQTCTWVTTITTTITRL